MSSVMFAESSAGDEIDILLRELERIEESEVPGAVIFTVDEARALRYRLQNRRS